MENEKSTVAGRVFLNDNIRQLVLKNKDLKDKIALAVGVDYWTVHRWLKNNSTKITHLSALQVMSEAIGVPYQNFIHASA